MTSTIQDCQDGELQDVARSASGAPPLPIEGHIVAAALTTDRLRHLAEQLLLILRHAPRDAATMRRVQNEALAAWSEVDDHYTAYLAVLECKGQG